MVGNLPHPVKGQQLRFVGDWVLHPKHGWQLKATAFEEVVPRSPQAVAAYLASTIDGESSRCYYADISGSNDVSSLEQASLIFVLSHLHSEYIHSLSCNLNIGQAI